MPCLQWKGPYLVEPIWRHSVEINSKKPNNSNKLDRLTDWRQSSRLCTRAVEELNQGLPTTNPTGGQRAGLALQIFQVRRCNHSATPLSKEMLFVHQIQCIKEILTDQWLQSTSESLLYGSHSIGDFSHSWRRILRPCGVKKSFHC